MRLLRHRRGNPETEYVEAYPTAPPLDSTLALSALSTFPAKAGADLPVGPRRGRPTDLDLGAVKQISLVIQLIDWRLIG